MLNRLVFLSSAIALLMAVQLEAAYLQNVPQTLVQPNGDTVRCFASGDEFYNWLHDEKGFTIVRDPVTGYLVYATMVGGKMVASPYVVDAVDPAAVSLKPGLKIPKDEYVLRREAFFAGAEVVNAPHTGTINNLCIFIRFSDQTEFPHQRSTYDALFNLTGPRDNSMRNYYFEASNEQLTISTTFYPTCPPFANLSYQDSHPRGYYQPYNAITNPNGYQNEHDRRVREHTLLRDAVNAVKSEVLLDLNIDGDGDGKVDNVCFIIRGNPDGWNDLLWPHQFVLSTYSVYINGKRVYNYDFQLESMLYVGVLCHEMFHSLGAPDLYHYSFDGLSPVDSWDLMEDNSNPPQHMGAYMKYRYGKWISSLLEIKEGGYYLLNPLTFNWWNSYKIRSSSSSSEYFVVEYRKKVGTFESSVPGSGLLVYRINTKKDGDGNAQGPPDEVYIYRPDGTPTENGDPWKAYFSADSGRVCINNMTNPSGFLSNGSLGDLFIADIGPIGNLISFFVARSYVQLLGNVYDGKGGPLASGDPDTYWMLEDAQVPDAKTLTVRNGARLYSNSGANLISFGTLNFEAGGHWTRFLTLSGWRAGFKSKGHIRITNGGVIKFH